MILDVLAPDDCGQSLIAVSLANPNMMPVAHQPVLLAIDYSACPTGVVLPIRITVTSGWSSTSYRKVDYRRVAPPLFAFTPREGGPHTVRVAELYHQRWQGVLKFVVGGDRLKKGTI